MDFVFATKGEQPAAGYPLFIYLHGSGPRDVEWATGQKLAASWDDAPAAYFIPRIPREGEYYRWWQKGKQWAWRRLLRKALTMPGIDPDRIYILGISEGGYGSQRLASFLADYLAAAGPMAGGEPLVNAPAENCRHLPFSFLTGADDAGFYRNILTRRTAEAFDSLAALYPGDYTHRIELIPGAGHHIDYSRTTPWLKSFRRNAMPRTVTWEDYDMDGCRRRGFYNLQPLGERKGRRRYDVAIDSVANAIDVEASDVAYSTVEADPNWGIPLRSERAYTPAHDGGLRIYLSDELADLDRPVAVRVNGIDLGRRRVERTREAIDRSISVFGDPRRVFTAYVDIDF